MAYLKNPYWGCEKVLQNGWPSDIFYAKIYKQGNKNIQPHCDVLPPASGGVHSISFLYKKYQKQKCQNVNTHLSTNKLTFFLGISECLSNIVILLSSMLRKILYT